MSPTTQEQISEEKVDTVNFEHRRRLEWKTHKDNQFKGKKLSFEKVLEDVYYAQVHP